MLKLFRPFVSKQAVRNVNKVLQSFQLAEGPQVKLFEKEFEEEFNKKYAVAVNSGTSALELAYELTGIGRGDEAISPVLTCTATNIPLKRRGAKIVWADIDTDLNIDIEDVKRKITPKTKAIVFVHFGGNNRGLKEILALGRRHRITIIEDACQAVGSDYWGKADFTAVSFQAIKILTTGDGGMLLCKRKKDYKKARRLRWFGLDREKKRREGDIDFWELGHKYHMNDIAAAIGRGNLEVIGKEIAHRKKLIKIYRRNGFLANIWLAIGFSGNREGLFKHCRKKGIELGIHHYRNDKYSAFGGKRLNLPTMNALENMYYLSPLHHYISLKDVRYICKTIKDYEKS